jgi:ketosteroid isomerase-like protein
MKRAWVLVLLLSVSALAAAGAISHTGVATADDPSFKAFLTRFEQGTSDFINGDARLWKQNASRRDDVTLMGGWGTSERGWSEAGARYDWAAARFEKSGATVKVDYLASAVTGDLAYTVAIERSEVRLVGQAAPAAMALRVSHVFRKEPDGWKLVHRHADPLMHTTSADSVLKK